MARLDGSRRRRTSCSSAATIGRAFSGSSCAALARSTRPSCARARRGWSRPRSSTAWRRRPPRRTSSSTRSSRRRPTSRCSRRGASSTTGASPRCWRRSSRRSSDPARAAGASLGRGRANRRRRSTLLQRAGQRAFERSAYIEASPPPPGARAAGRLATGRARAYELQLLVALGPVVVGTQGYSNPEVEVVYARARELAIGRRRATALHRLERAPALPPVACRARMRACS